jgi:Flp pilus assembly CpaE family ATPase
VAFTSAKPGSGASTIAAQLAIALWRGGKKVLAADLDPMAATLTFYLGHANRIPAGGSELWTRIIENPDGQDILPAEDATGRTTSAAALREFLERAREAYDWVLLDLPALFHRSTLQALPEADRLFLITTAELPSLHLTRKAINLLGQLGFGRERIRVLANRVEHRWALTPTDLAKILNAPVYRSFSDESFAVGPALAGDWRLRSDCVLRKEIAELASDLAGLPADKKKGALEDATVPSGIEVRARGVWKPQPTEDRNR